MPAKSKLSAELMSDDPLWYKDAIIYEVHVKAFMDSNGDGVGDFTGLISKLDYIQDLGVNTIWLLPFYPSPQRDDGYDISDYRNIHTDYGTMADFRTLISEAHRRGLRVITELVINHTSDQHPWFQAARHAPPGSAKRDYYVWSDTVKKFEDTRIIFSDTEKSNWAWDDVAKAYYWHRFFSHQPDLNHNNPHVVKAVMRVMRFWFDIGVDGVRLDAIPYLCVREGTTNENLPETHDVIKYMRAELDKHYKNRMFLAEANQWPEEVRGYFGEGDECHMAYHFPLMPRMYMAIAQEDRHPIVEIMQQTPEIPANSQWAIFLRNHDELTLEMVTSKERDYMYQMYAADTRARINLGIRRRLGPLMDNDHEKIKLMNSLLFSMPGSPIIYYGDEIGMGDNIYLGDRNGVRTPMQWSPDRNAGFSRADPQRLFLPPVMDPVRGYEAVNVEAQLRDPSSLLNWMRRLLAVRKTYQAFGRGKLIFLRPGNRKILAFLREYDSEVMLCVNNLARTAQPVELDLSNYKGSVPLELMGRTPFPPIGELPYLLTLPGYGFYWFRLAKGAEVPEWHEERLQREELPVVVLFDGWPSFFRERVIPWRISMAEKAREQLETEVLPNFVAGQRWYAAKDTVTQCVALTDHAEWGGEQANWLMGIFRVEGTGAADASMYFLPLALAWEDDDERMDRLMPATIARVRQQARIGIMGDAFSDVEFCRALVEAMGEGFKLVSERGLINFLPTSAFAKLVGEDISGLTMHTPGAQSSNTTVQLGDHLFLKGYRRLQTGTNPEVEIGRFLAEVSHFKHAVPVAGVVEYEVEDGSKCTLAVLQGYVSNQGDGWNTTLNYLERFLEYSSSSTEAELSGEAHGGYLALVHTLGVRTAELHKAFALTTGDPAFDPESIEQDDLDVWMRQVREEAVATLDQLERNRSRLDIEVQALADSLLSRRKDVLKHIETCVPSRVAAIKTRYHGDYHLGQVLLVENDFMIIDFEGEPARPLSERRQKHSSLKDVAGMLRSFNYALYTMLARLSTERPDDFVAFQPYGKIWEAEVRRAFLNAYEETTRDSGLYGAWEDAKQLLELFVLEKALYELRYELANRPEWVAIPLRGILEVVNQGK